MTESTPGRKSCSAPGALVSLLRVREWVKSGFVLAPLLFSGELVDASSVWSGVLAAVSGGGIV